jgi:hypothetical protein
MAITDDQMEDLRATARKLGEQAARDEGPLRGWLRFGPISLVNQVSAIVLDVAADEGMRTDDEYDAPVTLHDLPAIEDRRDLRDEFLDAAGPQTVLDIAR